VKCKTSHGENEKKGELRIIGMSPYGSNVVRTPIMLEPLKFLKTLFPSKLYGILREGGYGCHMWYPPRVDH
jgi:hypothetical protein